MPPRYPLTDAGNAERFTARHGTDYRWVPGWKKWLRWDGQRWAHDEGECHARTAAVDVARHILDEIDDHDDQEARQRLQRWASSSENVPRINAMLTATQPLLAIPTERLDAAPYILNCRNGTLDLSTGQLHPHDRSWFCTKVAGDIYDPDMPAQWWPAFVKRIFDGDTALVEFVQRSLGYAATGYTTEDHFWIAHGPGQNGKTVLREAVAHALGDYATALPATALLDIGANQIPNDIATLRGARFVTASETGKRDWLRAERIKLLTGGDTLTARYLYSEFFTFRPTHKLWLFTNHAPHTDAADPAIWRRLLLAPFAVRIPDDERIPQLDEYLQVEAPYILAWLARGARAWLEHNGLAIPPSVQAATDAYRAEEDIIGRFLEECTEQDPEGWVAASTLYRAYARWCDEEGHKALSNTAFGKEIVGPRYGLQRCRKETGKGYSGLRLVSGLI